MSGAGGADSQAGLRDEFVLRPGVIFLNHGSFGACPRAVLEAFHAWHWDLESQPVEFLQRRLNTLLGAARKQLGLYVGAQADDLVFVPNATSGLAIVARRLRLQPDDEVLSTDHEYGSMESTWSGVCETRGARYLRQHVPLPVDSPEQVLEAVWSGVTARTRVLFFSHISSGTALRFPMEQLVARARERGILTVVDGAHGPGQIPLYLESSGVDVYIGSGHKWMMGPKGTGFVYARRSALAVLWGEGHTSAEATAHSLAELQWQGTRDIPAYLTIPACIRFMDEHDWPAHQQRCHALVQRARRHLAELTGLPQPVPDSEDWYAQMAVLPIPACDSARLKADLYDRYRIEIPVTSFGEQLFLRLSAQAYNTTADIDALVGALAELLTPPARQAR